MTTYLPDVGRSDYEAVRNLLHPYLASTYDEWLKLRDKQIKDTTARGNAVKTVKIDSSELARYVRANGAKPDTLNLFAFEKGTGNIQR